MQVVVTLIVRHGVRRNRCARLSVSDVADEEKSSFALVVFRAVGDEAIPLADAVGLNSATEEDDSLPGDWFLYSGLRICARWKLQVARSRNFLSGGGAADS
jgi:hypothetical protein